MMTNITISFIDKSINEKKMILFVVDKNTLKHLYSIGYAGNFVTVYRKKVWHTIGSIF